MTAIEQKNLGPGYSSQDPLSSTISQGTSSLSFHEFAGLFLVVGSVTVLALFFSETPLGRKLSHKTRQFIHSCINYKISRLKEDSSVGGDSSEDGGEDVQNNSITSPEVEMHEIDETSAAQDADETIHTNAQNS